MLHLSTFNLLNSDSCYVVISERDFERCEITSLPLTLPEGSGQLWGQGSIWGSRALPGGPQCFQDLSVQNKFCTITTTLNHNIDGPLLFFFHHYQANQAEITKQYYIQLTIDSHHHGLEVTCLYGHRQLNTLFQGHERCSRESGGQVYINSSFTRSKTEKVHTVCLFIVAFAIEVRTQSVSEFLPIKELNSFWVPAVAHDEGVSTQ